MAWQAQFVGESSSGGGFVGQSDTVSIWVAVCVDSAGADEFNQVGGGDATWGACQTSGDFWRPEVQATLFSVTAEQVHVDGVYDCVGVLASVHIGVLRRGVEGFADCINGNASIQFAYPECQTTNICRTVVVCDVQLLNQGGICSHLELLGLKD
ncbi:hypothetical protein [Duganella sp. S19_KUP01_CR8]|uniref:hypothetical protein n=1 Tax=Duganella sp. S19_KUP01_CR8 TaxID=3025502 RepID=UPI002FCDABAB